MTAAHSKNLRAAPAGHGYCTELATSAGLVAALRRQFGLRLLETHMSWVLLGKDTAWKIKKPVRWPFLDASDLATRRRLCEQELRLNRRLAPCLYLDVVPIRGSPTMPVVDGGAGPPIEYALRMKRFGRGALFSERLAAGRLRPAHLDQLAQRLAAFHAQAAVAKPNTNHGSAEVIEGAMREVLDGLSGQGHGPDCVSLRQWAQQEGKALRHTWALRKAEGHVREGHGDLHLANLVSLGREVTAFDCLEFDPQLRWIDTCNDIAFLVMDLMAHQRDDLAWRFLNAYLDASGDHMGVASLRYYLVYRALVRAYVAGLYPKSGQPDYLALAARLSQVQRPRLLITHGLSGSGKSVLSQALLEQTAALRLRSDVERLRLFPPKQGESPARTQQRYGPQANLRTYQRLRQMAALALQAGWPVIVDATFLRAQDRDDFRGLAAQLGVPFAILDCHAPLKTLRDRVRRRGRIGRDPSQAKVQVLTQQLLSAEPLRGDELACTISVQTHAGHDLEGLIQRWQAIGAGA